MVSLVRDYFIIIMGLISFSPILAQELLEKIDSQWTGVQFQNSISNPQLKSNFLEAFIVDENEHRGSSVNKHETHPPFPR